MKENESDSAAGDSDTTQKKDLQMRTSKRCSTKIRHEKVLEERFGCGMDVWGLETKTAISMEETAEQRVVKHSAQK